MRRSFLLAGIALILLAFAVPSSFLFGQSRIPDDDDQYLQLVNYASNGDTDGFQVVFFEVPDTMTDTLYFAVQDPGTSGPDRYPDSGTADETDEYTTYTLIGGSGALSDSTSREADYSSSGNDPTSAGTTLDTMTFEDETGWYYFDGVAPSQGEHIGSKYYFKVVAQMTLDVGNSLKNGFKFDVSTSDAVSEPTGSTEISAFAYAWTISLDDRQPEENGGELVWSMYPFVPDTDTGNLVSHNWDADNSGIHEMYDTAGNYAGTVTISGTNDEETTSFALGGADTRGATWELRVTEEDDDSPSYVNPTSYWHTNSASGEIYRTYASSYTPNAIDSVTLTVDDGIAVADNSETERVILQIVDSSGDAVSYSRDIYVTVNNSAVIDAVSDDTGYTPATTALITTDSSGMGWLDVRDGTEETVTVTAYWDGTGSSSDMGTSSSDSTTIDFVDFYAYISSASATNFTVGDSSTVIPDITITADTAKADSTFTLVIKIPDGLSAEFNDSVSPTLGGAISGIVTGTSFDTTSSFSIDIDGAIADGDTLTVADLEMQNFTSASNGSLELSWDGGVSYSAWDDKLYIIEPSTTIVSRETVDLDSNGQIDGILMTAGDDLNDDFTSITVDVTGYTVSGYNTGAAAGSSSNDDIFLVVLDESGTSDTGATPDVEITANTSLASSVTSTLVSDDGGTAVAATDAAPPVLVSAESNFPVYGGNLVSGTFGSISYTELTLTFSEDIDTNSAPGLMDESDFKVEPDGSTAAGDLDGATASVAFGSNSTDIVVTLSSDTTGGLWTSSGEIDLDTFTNITDDSGNDAVENTSTDIQISGLSATAISWDGGGGSTDWNTAANWNPNQVPGESSAVTIPNTGAPWPEVPAGGVSIFSLQIDADAELSTGGNSLYVFDSFNIDGTLRRQGGDIVNQTDTDSGTVVYDTASSGDIQDYGTTDYYNLSFEDAVSFSTGTELTVAGTLTVGDGTNTSTLTAGGDVTTDALVINADSVLDAANYDLTMTSSYNNNDGQLRTYPGTSISRMDTDSGETVYYGSGGQIQDFGTTDYFDLTIEGSTYTYSLADSLTVAGTLTVTNGTLETGANSLSAAAISVNDVLAAGGQTGTETFSIAGTTPDLSGTGSLSLGAGAADIDGDISITTLTGGSAAINVGGYFVPGSFAANTTTVVLDGTDTPVDLGSFNFNNLTISKSAEADEVSSLGGITVTGTLSLTSGTWTAGAYTHSIAGDWDSSSTTFSFTEAGSTILLTGASPAISTEGTTDPFENLEIDGDAVQGSDLSAGGTLTVNTGGSLDTNDQDLSVTGDTTLSGTAELIGGTGTIDLGGDLSGAGTFTGGSGAVSIDGTVSGISSFTESSATTTLSGTAVTFASSGFTANSGTLIFDGTTTLTSNGETLGNVQIGTGLTGGSLTAADDLRIGGSFSAGTAATTALDISSVNMYVAADLNLTNLDTFTVTGSTVYLNGAGDLTSAGHSFNNLSISDDVTLQDALDVAGTLAITAGSLDVNALGPYQVSVGGDWNNSVGAAGFVERTGTVVLNNTGTIQNAETFYDLDVTAGTRSNSTGFSVSNDLTVSGTGALELSGGMSVTNTAVISAGSVTADTGGTVSIGTLTLSGGDLTVNSPASLSVTTGDFTISDAASAFTGSGTVGVDTANLVLSDGSYTGSGSYTVAGGLSLSGGTFSPTGAGLVTGDMTVNGAVTSTLTNTLSAANADFSGAGSVTANNTLSLSGNLDMSDGTLNGTGLIDIAGNVSLTDAAATFSGDGRTIQVAGNWSETAAVFVGDSGSGTGVVVLDGASSITASNSFYDLTVSGSATLATAITVDNDLSIGAGGSLDAAGLQMTVGGDWDNSAGGTFTPNNNLVEFDNTGSIVNAETFYDLNVTAGTRSNSTGFTVSNNLSVSGTGALELSGGMSVTNTATISAGSVTADTGGTVSIGTLTLSGGDLTVNSPVSLSVTTGDFTINAAASTFTGSGTVGVDTANLVLSDGSYIGSGSYAVAGNVQLSGGTFSPTGAGNVAGDVDVSGAVTSTLTNTLSAANAVFSGAGSVTANNNLSLSGNLYMSDGTLDGTGLIDIGGDVSLTAVAASLSGDGRTIQVAGNWSETAAVFVSDSGSGTGVVVFDGTSNITTSNSFYNFTVSGSAVLASAIVIDNDLSIGAVGSLDAAGFQMDVGGDWDNGSGGTFTPNNNLVVFDGSAQQIDAGGNNGRFHSLTVSGGATVTLSGSALYVDNILSITGTSVFDAADLDFTIVELDFNDDTDEFHLEGTQATQNITTADTANGLTVYNGASGGSVRLSDFYDLSINGTGTFLVDPGDINIYGDLSLGSGTLNGNGNTIRIQGDFDGSAGGSFDHGNGTVQYFGSGDAVISGDNTFYNFIADDTLETDLSDGTDGKIIQIASNSTLGIAAGGTFQVRGDNTIPPADQYTSDWITRGYTTSWITLKSTDTGVPPYWTLSLDGTAALDLQYVDVWFSYADPAVNVPDDTYVHGCDEWLSFIYISDSFTRDTDGNGKIDIIEAVVPVNLDDNFTNFEVVVNGYDQSGAVTTGSGTNDRAFWINLEEKPYLDTDATPSWYIVDSGDLRDSATGNYQVTHEAPKGASDPEVPWDDADPVVGYTLAVAGQNEVFIHFSEPVYGSGGGDLLVPETDISGPAGNTVSSISVVSGAGGGEEVLLTMSSPVSATDIAGGSLLTFANMDDNAADPTPVSPAWTGQPDGPNPLADTDRRISDLGLSSDSSGIMYPVWASDGTSISSERGGLGLIRSFDGSDFLQDEDILLEATIHSDLSSLGLSPDILYDGDVPEDYLEDSLWLPESVNANGLVPYLYPDASTRSISGLAHSSGSTSLWQFTLPASDEDISSGVQLDFFLKTSYLGNDLYIARLDQPNASDWYRSVEPWSFRVQDLDQQTAQVSIFSNVINPLEGEKATLHYVLEDSGLVTITVFDLAGDLVDVIERGRKTAGEYSTTWDGRNRGGRVVARGIYFIRVVGPDFDEYRKVMVVK